jgi:hypothetical protein
MIIQQNLVTLTTAGTVYSIAIPPNATNLKFQCREMTEIILYSYDNFAHYWTVPIPAAGAAANNTGIVQYPDEKTTPAGQTLYLKDVANSGKHVEVEWAIDG